MGPGADLALDWRIRLWVLLPISLATALMAVLRFNVVSLLLRAPRVDLFKVRDASALSRAAALRRGGHALHPAQVAARRSVLGAADGPLRRAAASSTSPLALLMSPESLGNQVVGLLTSTVPSVVLGAWARFLFGGIAVCRLPFPLSQRFRGMLQAGIERAGQSLDVRYVSALSWFVINLFGNASIVELFLSRDGEAFDMRSDKHAADVAGQLASSPQGFNDARDAERKALHAFEHRCGLADLEAKLIASDPTAAAGSL
jgi:ER membrane protein complex subunit 3